LHRPNPVLIVNLYQVYISAELGTDNDK